MFETQKYWFAIRTRDRQEFAICKSLSRLKSEKHSDVDYYLPTRIAASQSKYRRKHSEVPVICSLVFICTTKRTVYDFSNVHGVRLLCMKNLFTRSMPVVPDRQMSDSMFVMDLNPDSVSLDDGSLVVGNRVCIVKGDLTGVEGEAVTDVNRAYAIIRTKDALTANVEVPKFYLKIIE